MKLVWSQFLALLVVAGQVKAQQLYEGPIIDMHLHAYTNESFINPGLPNPASGEVTARSDEELMHASLEALKKNRIVLAVLSGEMAVVDRWKAEAPGKIIPSPHSPHFGDVPDVEVLRHEIEGGRVHALAELAFQHAGIAPSDPEVEPFLALAEDLDVPGGGTMPSPFRQPLRRRINIRSGAIYVASKGQHRTVEPSETRTGRA